MQKEKNKLLGFTLTEVLAVVIILSLIVSIIFWLLGFFNSQTTTYKKNTASIIKAVRINETMNHFFSTANAIQVTNANKLLFQSKEKSYEISLNTNKILIQNDSIDFDSVALKKIKSNELGLVTELDFVIAVNENKVIPFHFEKIYTAQELGDFYETNFVIDD